MNYILFLQIIAWPVMIVSGFMFLLKCWFEAEALWKNPHYRPGGYTTGNLKYVILFLLSLAYLIAVAG